MIFQSQPNDFSFCAKRSIAERCLKHPSACNINIMNGLPYILKDEGSFCKTPM